MEKAAERRTRFRPARRILIIALSIATLITVLAVGLGVGLQSRHHSSKATIAITNTELRQSIWQPTVNISWQIVLNAPLKLDSNAKSVTPDVDVFDIDLYSNLEETIRTLHTLGKRVICYFSAGSYEPYRPDSNQFEEESLGNALIG
jgi:hypothetical protein